MSTPRESRHRSLGCRHGVLCYRYAPYEEVPRCARRCRDPRLGRRSRTREKNRPASPASFEPRHGGDRRTGASGRNEKDDTDPQEKSGRCGGEDENDDRREETHALDETALNPEPGSRNTEPGTLIRFRLTAPISLLMIGEGKTNGAAPAPLRPRRAQAD